MLPPWISINTNNPELLSRVTYLVSLSGPIMQKPTSPSGSSYETYTRLRNESALNIQRRLLEEGFNPFEIYTSTASLFETREAQELSTMKGVRLRQEQQKVLEQEQNQSIKDGTYNNPTTRDEFIKSLTDRQNALQIVQSPVIYELHLKTFFNPEVSDSIKSRISTIMSRGGYSFNDIMPYGGGYLVQFSKIGSIPVVLIIWAIISLLGVVGFREYRLVKTSSNQVELQQEINETTALNEGKKLYDMGIITRDEYLELLRNSSQGSSDGNGFLGGLGEGIGAIAIGVLAVALLSKK